MIITLLELHYLVAFGPGKLVGDHVEEVVGAPRNATA